MEIKKLPNVTIALILGIVSFIACCLSYGIGGLVLAGIALFLVKKDAALLDEDPNAFENAGQLKTAKIVAIISIVLSVLYLVFMVGVISWLGWDIIGADQQEMQERVNELLGQ
ncbi:MAG: CCC motif membrane protein [Flavobacteriaceae bacterium]|nr:CCC motif membrane protein [Flavobacteriaceae bacterium]